MIPQERLIREARDLRSEHGENPEYDRALVELTSRTLGLTEDDRPLVEAIVLHDYPAIITVTDPS